MALAGEPTAPANAGAGRSSRSVTALAAQVIGQIGQIPHRAQMNAQLEQAEMVQRMAMKSPLSSAGGFDGTSTV